MKGKFIFFFFQAEDGRRDLTVTGVHTCALPILLCVIRPRARWPVGGGVSVMSLFELASMSRLTLGLSLLVVAAAIAAGCGADRTGQPARSEEHTSELQSQSNLVCRLLLEKKKQK